MNPESNPPPEGKVGRSKDWRFLGDHPDMHPDDVADRTYRALSHELPRIVLTHLALALDKGGGEPSRRAREYFMDLFFVKEEKKELPPWEFDKDKPRGAAAFTVSTPREDSDDATV